MAFTGKATRTLPAAIAVALLLTVPAAAKNRNAATGPTISTVAGCCEPTGKSGYSGDGGPATSAEFFYPYGVAVDASANFYIADQDNCLTRKVTALTGVITTAAGTATGASTGSNCGYSGDGGPATSAELNDPTGVAVDTAGNLYIADATNFVIRKVTAATGVIATVAGCCESTGGPGTGGYSGDGGPATSAALSFPYGIAVDSAGNLYIADAGNNVIRKVTASTGLITTVAGCCETSGGPGTGGYSGDGGPATSAELFSPYGVAVDSAGNLYIADTVNNVVRMVTASTGAITTVAGDYALGGSFSGDGGPATSAALYNPTGVVLDSAGNIYIADSSNNVVREVTVPTGVIDTAAGDYTLGRGYSGDGGAATSAQMSNPTGLALDSAGNFYIADDNNQVIRQVNASSQATTSTTVASSVNPSVVGQAVTFTASVSGGSSPTGSVGFTSNGAAIGGCSAVALSAGTAQCITAALAAGSDLIIATYSGDSDNAGSSGSLTQVVNTDGLTATTTTLTSSSNPSGFGQNVVYEATITPAGPPTPTGTVSFTSNGAIIAGCSAVTVSLAAAAGCATTTLAAGTDTIVAAYSGDGNYSGSSGTLSQLVNPPPTAVQFVPVTPCRVVDTRNADGAFGGPALAAGETRSFALPKGPCPGVSVAATAYSLNVTVVPPAPLGFLTIWPAGEGQPLVSTLNSLDGRIKANAAIVPAGTGAAVNVYVNNASNVVLDINGYFEAESTSTLEFYPLTPCRVADTRKSSGYATGLGAPSLVADTERDFPIINASGNTVPCDIPTTALAYSLNFTAVPPSGAALGYLSVWPQGESRPVVSTLNDLTGTIVANAALVPAGTGGGVAVYPSNDTDLVIDVNGYFAPAATGGLQLYTLTPCRVLDTRNSSGAFNGELVVNVDASFCMPPTPQAYVFNATVVPPGELGYLTLWPDSETQPVVSTLNALDGEITSNMAIVPSVNGSVDAFASGATQLVLDISAYFAP